ncbi:MULTISPECIES: acyl-CoA dehydrogenase [unclassified Pseudomonas]|uniref:acyl-CoA dehydrogenase n=1 Tax=unclassified Pseudomonas TaxID=196821 RepID=UPI00244934DF|nr:MULTISPECIES: acyl-CoA dehydrogenase [unclassified Pseudomonas]MDG9924273.1 acyl-CoA dehydrogenase [Pseudomonas sp. GD04045]MDH0033314.1 acyl-CoA dehydrogenase [Pseudomonas sp. GD04019]
MPWQPLLETRDRLSASNLDDWYAALLERVDDGGPFALAVLGGRLAATPGLAFLAGYQGALRALWPAAPLSLGALCVTENRSTRPADLQTRLSGLHLSGRKDFVTAADAADWLLVAARVEEEGAPRLAVGVVRSGAPGARIEPLPALPLMPDIGHARLHLDNSLCELLPGDGWDSYVKPFRSIEDLHVLAALSAWLYGVGRDSQWPQDLLLRLLALLSGCAEVARHNPSDPVTHLLLAGLFAQFKALRPELDAAIAAGPQQWAALWARDCNLLEVARTAREKRLEKALAELQL